MLIVVFILIDLFFAPIHLWGEWGEAGYFTPPRDEHHAFVYMRFQNAGFSNLCLFVHSDLPEPMELLYGWCRVRPDDKG